VRIAHLNKRYWPHIGGIERSLHTLARACVRRGDQVSALVCAEGNSAARHIVEGVEVIEAPSFGVIQSQPIAPAYLRLPRVAGTVWHLHEPFPLGTLALSLYSAGRRSVPLVVTWHSDVVRQRALKRLHVALARRLLKRAMFIHVPTEAHITNSEVLREFREKVRVIPFIVDVPAMRRRADHPLALDLRHWADGSPVVLAVGRLVYYKGVDVLLDALALTRKIRLVVVGDGPLRRKLHARALELGLAHRVRWLGSLTDEDLIGAFSGADLFVLASVARSEAFGIVQVEAMAAGLPVVSTRLGTSVEVVNVDGSSGVLVRPRDAPELAEAMRAIADDSQLRSRLSAGALDRAEDFTESRLVGRYREMYAQVAEARE
jgi:glycosyltransferase involved in cell wall biosynthesis